MDFRSLKRALVQITTAFALLVLAFLAYAEFATHSGRAKAEALCKTIPIGTDAALAETAISGTNTDSQLRRSGPDHMGVGFPGAFLDRWFCDVSISGGKVVDNEVRLID
ncbi:hypothetical protein [Zoogloea sp.]|uniref:hypothetical protein n=1 Tax=Zoogloea sp. TaxID=49181 RepID=UPI0035B2FED8